VSAPVELTDSDGAMVLSLEVYRRRYASEERKHRRVRADEELSDLLCLDCKARVSPIAYIVRVADSWRHTEANRRAAIHEQERAQLRSRVRCHKCGEMASIWTSTEIEKRRKATREARHEAALAQIGLLSPETAAKEAGKIARAALAARDETPPTRLAVVSEAKPGDAR
jgi:hypothetical protein